MRRNEHDLCYAAKAHAGEAALVELWAPPCIAEYDSLRPLYYAAADLFLVIFSVTEKESLQVISSFPMGLACGT